MQASRATQIIEDVVYKPGWKFEALVSDRFEEAVTLQISYAAPNFSRENAPDYLERTMANASFMRLCTPDCTDDSIVEWVFHCIMQVEQHEAREAFRLAPMMYAPFHPHRQDGMQRFGDPDGDLRFGVA